MTTDAGTARWVAVAEVTDLQRRRKKRVEVDGRAIALFLVGDRVFALDDTCVHKGRSLSRGALWKGRVVCPAHQWSFDPATGRAEDQDDCQPVHDVRVVDGMVLVDPQPRLNTGPERPPRS